MCDECWLKIARETSEDPDFVDVLAKLGTGYCNHLEYEILPFYSQQQINKAKDDSEVLHIVRTVSEVKS